MVSVGVVPYTVALWSLDLNLKPLHHTHLLTGLNPEDKCLILQISQTVLRREKHPHICVLLWMSAPLISTVFSNSQVSVVFNQALISCGRLLALLKLNRLAQRRALTLENWVEHGHHMGWWLLNAQLCAHPNISSGSNEMQMLRKSRKTVLKKSETRLTTSILK